MAEKMTFLPKQQILSLEEIYKVVQALVDCGVKKIRLTGGEPLVRHNVIWLIEQIAKLNGLEELSLTTNGSQLSKMAGSLYDAGLSRINVSLDSLNPKKFREITRTGELKNVLDGIEAARNFHFKKIKINSVILKNRNDDEIIDLLDYAIDNELDIAFIEEMPLGDIIEHNRLLAYCSSDEVRGIINQKYPLSVTDEKTNGPSTYYRIDTAETNQIRNKIGFISPHSHNFCGDCNRVRVTVEGQLLLCLGNENSVDLKTIMRTTPDADILKQAIINSMSIKPERHRFDLAEETQIVRFMNMTGG